MRNVPVEVSETESNRRGESWTFIDVDRESMSEGKLWYKLRREKIIDSDATVMKQPGEVRSEIEWRNRNILGHREN